VPGRIGFTQVWAKRMLPIADFNTMLLLLEFVRHSYLMEHWMGMTDPLRVGE